QKDVPFWGQKDRRGREAFCGSWWTESVVCCISPGLEGRWYLRQVGIYGRPRWTNPVDAGVLGPRIGPSNSTPFIKTFKYQMDKSQKPLLHRKITAPSAAQRSLPI